MNREQRIEQIIEETYHRSSKELFLCSFVSTLVRCVHWREVLGFRDWSRLRGLEFGMILCEIDGCAINDSGAELLGRMNWPRLQTLSIGTSS